MTRQMERARSLFTNLFVLEAANNHWGRLSRGLRIVREHGTVARYNDVKAAIKFQFRDVETFIHPNFRGATDNRYISKTEATQMAVEDYARLVKETISVGAIPMATPFDEASVRLCEEFKLPIIKVASSDVNDWPLLERIAHSRTPVILSTGGASEKSLDDVVSFFQNRDIPLAINHCVSLYPCPNDALELNQIDYLRERYPGHVIGFSTHEYQDWSTSMHISYAKGARTWERHVDIEADDIPVSPYCSTPDKIDTWFKAFKSAREMCGGSHLERRVVSEDETAYLNDLVRGVYARRAIEPGYVFSKESFDEAFYLAIPLQKGQLSCREVMNGETLTKPIVAGDALTIDHVDGPFATNPRLRSLILGRGR